LPVLGKEKEEEEAAEATAAVMVCDGFKTTKDRNSLLKRRSDYESPLPIWDRKAFSSFFAF
jgi:hypothetical protein